MVGTMESSIGNRHEEIAAGLDFGVSRGPTSFEPEHTHNAVVSEGPGLELPADSPPSFCVADVNLAVSKQCRRQREVAVLVDVPQFV